MICPYCDSLLKETPESGTCPNCGGALARKGELDRQSKTFLDPPIGIYKEGLMYIEIGETSLRLFEEILLCKKKNRTIRYDEVYAVSFNVGVGVRLGYLTVRSKNNKSMPMPTTQMKAVADDETITFSAYSNEKFYNVYTFLKKCAEINAAE